MVELRRAVEWVPDVGRIYTLSEWAVPQNQPPSGLNLWNELIVFGHVPGKFFKAIYEPRLVQFTAKTAKKHDNLLGMYSGSLMDDVFYEIIYRHFDMTDFHGPLTFGPTQDGELEALRFATPYEFLSEWNKLEAVKIPNVKEFFQRLRTIDPVTIKYHR